MSKLAEEMRLVIITNSLDIISPPVAPDGCWNIPAMHLPDRIDIAVAFAPKFITTINLILHYVLLKNRTHTNSIYMYMYMCVYVCVYNVCLTIMDDISPGLRFEREMTRAVIKTSGMVIALSNESWKSKIPLSYPHDEWRNRTSEKYEKEWGKMDHFYGYLAKAKKKVSFQVRFAGESGSKRDS